MVKIEISHANDNKVPFKIQLKRFLCLTIFFLAMWQVLISLKGLFTV